MPQALIHLGEREDRILTIIKGKYGLKNKSDAVNHLIQQYEEELLEPELRPEFIERIERIQKGKFISYKGLEDLDRDIKHARVQRQ